jgi:hypothetical protein
MIVQHAMEGKCWEYFHQILYKFVANSQLSRVSPHSAYEKGENETKAGLCTDLLALTVPYGWGKPRKTSANRLSEGCAISHSLKWDLSPPNGIDGIV